MLRLVRKLNARLARPGRTTAQSPAPLPHKPGLKGQCWTPAEVRLLLQLEQEQTLLRARLENSRNHYHTQIMGVDLPHNQLLLQALSPALPAPQLVDDQPFWLSLPLPGGEYRLYVQPQELLPGHKQLVKILATRFSQRTPADNGVHFPDSQGPQVQLRLNAGKQVRGSLKRLSTQDALVSLTGDRIKPGTPIHCRITFNAHFVIHCEARIARVQKRMVELEFTQMHASDEVQLNAYLRACESCKKVAA